jgi:hypothetical protein
MDTYSNANTECNSQRNTDANSYTKTYSYAQAASCCTITAHPAVGI